MRVGELKTLLKHSGIDDVDRLEIKLSQYDTFDKYKGTLGLGLDLITNDCVYLRIMED